MRRVWLIAITFALAPLAGASVPPVHTQTRLPGEAPIAVYPQSHASLAKPGLTKLVTFVYNANKTYTILCLPGAVTDIELRPSERVYALALGDSIRWQAEKRGPHLFIRPLRSGLFTSATLVTNERTYELTLESAEPGGMWYQRVNWRYPNLVVLQQNRAEAELLAAEREAHAAAKRPPVRAAVHGIPVDQLNFNYTITGNAPFRPSQVFDDGTFTYIRFAHKPQEMPALFIQTPGGHDELAIYNFEPTDPASPGSPLIKVQRLFNKAVLKLGSQQVTITRGK